MSRLMKAAFISSSTQKVAPDTFDAENLQFSLPVGTEHILYFCFLFCSVAVLFSRSKYNQEVVTNKLNRI